MNKELAIKLLRESVLGTNEQLHEAVFMAIRALRAAERIKEIINISNFVIQEDVLKYKMICEIVEKMGGEENG